MTTSNMAMTAAEMMAELQETSYPRFNRAVQAAGIQPVARSGRGRGGGRWFSRSNLKDIKYVLSTVRTYNRKTA